MPTPRPAPSPHAALWGLDPDVVYLNHGAFGACPIAVRRAQAEWRDLAQGNPYAHYGVERPRRLAEARAALGRFVGAEPDELAFVPRATTGVNAVLRGLRFAPGDELVTTDHAYGPTRAALEIVAAAAGARVVVAPVPFPIRSPGDVTEAIVARVGPRTRLVVVDHVVSQTALVFPVAEIVREASDRGVEVLVDGAHAAGQVPLDLGALGAAYFVGNAHKWLGVPPSAGFVYVAKEKRPALLGARDAPLHDWLAWLMPHDPTPFLCLPHAIAHLGGALPGGWPALMARNRALAIAARDGLCRALGAAPPCPAEMVGSMAVIPLPPAAAAGWPDPLQALLFERERIVAPVTRAPDGTRLLRVSAQLYNTPAQYELLARTLVALLAA